MVLRDWVRFWLVDCQVADRRREAVLDGAQLALESADRCQGRVDRGDRGVGARHRQHVLVGKRGVAQGDRLAAGGEADVRRPAPAMAMFCAADRVTCAVVAAAEAPSLCRLRHLADGFRDVDVAAVRGGQLQAPVW